MTPFRLQGWHVLTMLGGTFALVVGVNATFVVMAVRSFPGEDAPNAYLQGIHYNETLVARAAQDALGWHASIDATRVSAANTVIRLKVVDANGAPVSGLTVNGVLRRPAQESADLPVAMADEGQLYVATIQDVPSGQWDLRLTARDSLDQEFAVEKRIWLP